MNPFRRALEGSPDAAGALGEDGLGGVPAPLGPDTPPPSLAASKETER